jgi:hypothetical protein
MQLSIDTQSKGYGKATPAIAACPVRDNFAGFDDFGDIGSLL